MATREEIYTAIRNADAAGDSKSVRALGEYLKTMPADSVAETPASPADVPGSPEFVALHTARQKAADDELASQTGVMHGVKNFAGDVLDFGKAAGDVGLTLGAQAVMTPLAGVAGAVTAPFGGSDKAADVVRAVQGAAYTPKSELGQAAVGNIQKPFEYVAGKADAAGGAVSDITGSPALGTMVNTAIQGAPALLSRGTRSAFSSAARGVVDTVKQVTPAGRAAAAAQTAALAAESATAAAAKAENYAGSVGLDWNSLSGEIKAQLTDIAKSAGQLEKLDPQALARAAKFGSLRTPVPATRGILERDRGTLLNENNAASTKAGQPIADIHAAANAALIDNLDVLKGRVSGTGKTAAIATSPEQAGGAVQGAARGKQLLAKSKTRAAYDRADSSPEAQVKVDTNAVRELISKLPDADQFKYAKSWLERNSEGAGSGTKIIDLQELRKLATRKAANGGEDALYAHDLMEAIDSATEAVAGPLYKEARAAHIAERTEFGDQAAVADLVDNTSRTDRATALSNTVRAVTSGAPEEIRQVKRTLLTGGDEATRTAGRQAWREVRTQVIEDIKARATRGIAPLKDGTPNLAPSGLKSAIDSYGAAKLDEIFGSGTTKELMRILDVAQDAKTIPPTGGAAVGSTTTQQLINFLQKGLTKGLDKIPGIGKLGAAGVQALSDTASERAAVNRATTTPLGDLAKAAAKAGARGQKRAALKDTTISSLATGEKKR